MFQGFSPENNSFKETSSGGFWSGSLWGNTKFLGLAQRVRGSSPHLSGYIAIIHRTEMRLCWDSYIPPETIIAVMALYQL